MAIPSVQAIRGPKWGTNRGDDFHRSDSFPAARPGRRNEPPAHDPSREAKRSPGLQNNRFRPSRTDSNSESSRPSKQARASDESSPRRHCIVVSVSCSASTSTAPPNVARCDFRGSIPGDPPSKFALNDIHRGIRIPGPGKRYPRASISVVRRPNRAHQGIGKGRAATARGSSRRR